VRSCLAASAVLAAGLLLAGCWNLVPVEDRGLATMLAIDTAPGGGFETTVAVLHPPGLPPPGPTGQGGGSGTVPLFLRSQRSADMVAALERIRAASYLQLDFTHLQALVVSEDAARAGLEPVLDYLARTPQFSLNGWLVVARGTSARDLLEATERDLPQPNAVLSKTIRQARWATPYYADRIFTLLKEIPLAGQAYTTVGIEQGPDRGERISAPFVIHGLAMFRRGQLVGWLDDGAALGWAAATGHLQHQALAVNAAGRQFDLELLGSRPRIQVFPAATGPSVLLTLRVTAHLASIRRPLGGGGELTEPALHALEGLAADALTADVEEALRQAQAVGADVFGLGEYVRLRDPSYWHRVAADWQGGRFAGLVVRVRAEVAIATAGSIVCPLFGRC
jgi:spore germination protein KC